jgi:hypothetical protein
MLLGVDEPVSLTSAEWLEIVNSMWKFGIVRVGCSMGDVPLNWALLDPLFTQLANAGIQIFFEPSYNYNDIYNYFGTQRWLDDLTALGTRIKNDSRIRCVSLYNEPFIRANVTPPNSTVATIQHSLAQGIDALRSSGDNHAVMLPDNEVYTNYSWVLSAEILAKGNLMQAFHWWFSDWAFQNYTSAAWITYIGNKIDAYRARYPNIPVWVTEFGIFPARLGAYAAWVIQQPFATGVINFCIARAVPCILHRYDWNNVVNGEYYNLMDQYIGASNWPDSCPVGKHWSGTQHICVDDVLPPPDSYVLDIWAINGGTTHPTGLQSYPGGSVVVITATPAQGYTFGGWLVNNVPHPASENPLSVTVTAATTVIPIFNVIPPSLPSSCTGAKEADGHITWSCNDGKNGDFGGCTTDTPESTYDASTGILSVKVKGCETPAHYWTNSVNVATGEVSGWVQGDLVPVTPPVGSPVRFLLLGGGLIVGGLVLSSISGKKPTPRRRQPQRRRNRK